MNPLIGPLTNVIPFKLFGIVPTSTEDVAHAMHD